MEYLLLHSPNWQFRCHDCDMNCGNIFLHTFCFWIIPGNDTRLIFENHQLYYISPFLKIMNGSPICNSSSQYVTHLPRNLYHYLYQLFVLPQEPPWLFVTIGYKLFPSSITPNIIHILRSHEMCYSIWCLLLVLTDKMVLHTELFMVLMFTLFILK